MRGLRLYFIPLVALVELYLLIKVGGFIGVLPTVGLVLLTGMIGVTLLRSQGFQLLAQLQEKMARGETPAQELLEGVALLLGGFCLLTPGFVTDTLGFCLLLPFTRKALIAGIAQRLAAQVQTVTMQQMRQPPPHEAGPVDSRNGGRTLEGEYTRDD